MAHLMRGLALASAVALIAGGVIAASSGEGSLLLWIFLGPAPFLGLAGYLLWRRPASRIAHLLVLVAALAMAIPAMLEAAVKAGHTGGLTWLALTSHHVLTGAGVAAATVMIGLFPSGRHGTRGERWFAIVAWSTPAVIALLLPASARVPVSVFSFPDHDAVANPLFVESLGFLGGVARAATQLVVVVFIAGVVLLVRRYRSTEVLRRRQIRWVGYASVAALALSAVPWVLGEMGVAPALTHGLLAVIGILPMLMLPASIVIAVLEPAWIDTDAVIRRSAAFGVLSFLVLLLYAGLAAGFGVAAGQRFPTELAIAITVVVAIGFHPLRLRLQAAVDRFVYGDAPDRFDAVAGLERTINQATSTGDLLTGLADTVCRSLRLRWVEVEMPPLPTHISGEVGGTPTLTMPIRHRDTILGWIRCGPPIRALRPGDTELLAILAGQTGLAVYNARLAARVVHAQEEERRRIERNIHDGAQQELVALIAKLGLARSQAVNGDIDESLLEELQAETMTILRDLRALAQGIHPTVLSDGGLVEAVRDRTSRLPIPVTVTASTCLDAERYSDEVEGAAYFFVTEAVTNVLKHSNASSIDVAIRHEGSFLEISVADDGMGFDPDSVRRNGLAGLSDRITALSGTVSVDAKPGHGARLSARLPVGRSHP